MGDIVFYLLQLQNKNAAHSGIGLCEDETGKTNYDELIIAEVMVNEVDKEWWLRFKQRLEKLFEQKEILIRAIMFEKI